MSQPSQTAEPAAEWGYSLRVAARENRLADLGALLAEPPAGSSIDDRDPDKNHTALMDASWHAHAGAAEILLAAGADPSLRDIYGCDATAFGRHMEGPLSAASASMPKSGARALFSAYLGDTPPPREYVFTFEPVVVAEGDDEKNKAEERARLTGRMFGMAVNNELSSEGLPRADWNSYGMSYGRSWLLPEEVEPARTAYGRIAERYESEGVRGCVMAFLSNGPEVDDKRPDEPGRAA